MRKILFGTIVFFSLAFLAGCGGGGGGSAGSAGAKGDTGTAGAKGDTGLTGTSGGTVPGADDLVLTKNSADTDMDIGDLAFTITVQNTDNFTRDDKTRYYLYEGTSATVKTWLGWLPDTSTTGQNSGVVALGATGILDTRLKTLDNITLTLATDDTLRTVDGSITHLIMCPGNAAGDALIAGCGSVALNDRGYKTALVTGITDSTVIRLGINVVPIGSTFEVVEAHAATTEVVSYVITQSKATTPTVAVSCATCKLITTGFPVDNASWQSTGRGLLAVAVYDGKPLVLVASADNGTTAALGGLSEVPTLYTRTAGSTDNFTALSGLSDNLSHGGASYGFDMDVANGTIWTVSTGDGKSLTFVVATDNLTLVNGSATGVDATAAITAGPFTGTWDNYTITFVALPGKAGLADFSVGDNVSISANVVFTGDSSETHTLVAAEGPFIVTDVTSSTISLSGATDEAMISTAALDIPGVQAGVLSLTSPYIYASVITNGTTVVNNPLMLDSAAIIADVQYPGIAAHPSGDRAAVCYRENSGSNGVGGRTMVRIITGTSDGIETVAVSSDNLSHTLGTGHGCAMAWYGTTSSSDNGTLYVAKASNAVIGSGNEALIVLSKSTDNGTTFTQITQEITADADEIVALKLAIDIALDGSDVVIAVRAIAAIELWRYSSSTGLFEEITRQTPSTGDDTTPVSVAVNGTAYAVSYFTSGGAPLTDIYYNE